jgi:lipopolysaccharide/colanic/teichoic acid biosynthesis glycosyltransferase
MLESIEQGSSSRGLDRGFESQDQMLHSKTLNGVSLSSSLWNGLDVKLLLDVILASIMFVFALPLMFVVVIALALQRKGVFYSQERVGAGGTKFKIFKFRTMYLDAEKNGPFICADYEDSRITKFGRFLRKTKLDELPQLLNVIKGEMSLVGPRPERPYFHKINSDEILGWEKRIQVKPGITGIAQISRRISHDPAQKLEADIVYIRNRSLFLDLKLLIITVFPRLRPKRVFGVEL